jgi:hypothetical protein
MSFPFVSVCRCPEARNALPRGMIRALLRELIRYILFAVKMEAQENAGWSRDEL